MSHPCYDPSRGDKLIKPPQARPAREQLRPRLPNGVVLRSPAKKTKRVPRKGQWTESSSSSSDDENPRVGITPPKSYPVQRLFVNPAVEVEERKKSVDTQTSWSIPVECDIDVQELMDHVPNRAEEPADDPVHPASPDHPAQPESPNLIIECFSDDEVSIDENAGGTANAGNFSSQVTRPLEAGSSSRKDDDDDDDGPLLAASPPHFRRPKRIRKDNYTPSEDKKILDYLLKENNATEVGGVKLWKRMEAEKVVDRTDQSMKNRFMKTLWFNLEDYLTPEQVKVLEAGRPKVFRDPPT